MLEVRGRCLVVLCVLMRGNLKLSNQRAKDRNPPRKFSSLIKHLVVELDRDTTLYPEGNVIEVRTPLFLSRSKIRVSLWI